MKIGILTFHRAHNYGAVLQCYALQEILRSKGHDVRVIDYRQRWIEEFYKFISIDLLRRNSHSLPEIFAYIKKNVKKFLLAPCKARNFKSFRNRSLRLTSSCQDSIPQDFDCYMIGSDQLWSLHCLGGETDPIYMGDFARPAGSRLIGYAISADINSIETIAGKLSEWIDGFDALSMREDRIAHMVSEISGRPCFTCLDPTLLTDASLWEPLMDDKWKSRKYVLVYEVRWKKENKGLLKKKAQELAAAIGDGCSVIDISSGNYSVRDFVSMFRYAQYVVTTSFHGTVFSLIFETPFYVLPLWNNYDLRYMELLHSIGADDRIVPAEIPLHPVNVDFRPFKRELAELQKKSFGFIDKALA